MTPRDIIAEAWALTTRERKLRRWGFFSSLLETLFSIKLIGYQAYFAYAYFFSGHSVGFFDDFIWLYGAVSMTWFATIMVLFGILLLLEWFMPHLALGAIIGLAAKSHKREPVRGGLVLALYNFFPLFALHEFLTLSSISMVITISSLILRYIPGEVRFLMIGITLTFWVLSNILKFFFSFAPPIIVIEKAGIFSAMGKSFKLIVSHLSQIMFLLVLLFVISIRVAVNAAIVLLIPALVIGLGIFLSSFFSMTITYLITTIVGIALVIAASYFFAYLHVFREAVWTITYLELRKQKDLDDIG